MTGLGSAGPPREPGRPPAGLEFTLLNGLFDRILNQFVEPFVIEGFPGPDGRLDKQLKLVMAGLANIAVGYVEVIPVIDGLLDNLSAYVAD
jgi:hypothetical protein